MNTIRIRLGQVLTKAGIIYYQYNMTAARVLCRGPGFLAWILGLVAYAVFSLCKYKGWLGVADLPFAGDFHMALGWFYSICYFTLLVAFERAFGVFSPDGRVKVFQYSLGRTPGALPTLANDPSPKVRRLVAQHNRTPIAVMTSLTADPSIEVRLNLARNATTPASVLLILATDPDQSVRAEVQRVAPLANADGWISAHERMEIELALASDERRQLHTAPSWMAYALAQPRAIYRALCVLPVD